MRLGDHSERFHAYPNSKSELFLYGAHTATVPASWTCSRHLHYMMFEINLVLCGTQYAEIAGVNYRQNPDDIVLVPPMALHAYKADSPMSYFVFHVQLDNPAFLQQLSAARLTLITRAHSLHERLLSLIRRMHSHLAEGGRSIERFYTLYGIIDCLERYIKEERDARQSEKPDLPARVAREIENRVALSEDALAAGNWMAEVAGKVGYSRRHCSRVFQEAYGMSPRSYLSILRQQEAMQLLANDRMTIEQVSRRVGYDNVQSFIRQFVKWTAITPGTFRKRERQDGNTIYLTPLELERRRDG